MIKFTNFLSMCVYFFNDFGFIILSFNQKLFQILEKENNDNSYV